MLGIGTAPRESRSARLVSRRVVCPDKVPRSFTQRTIFPSLSLVDPIRRSRRLTLTTIIKSARGLKEAIDGGRRHKEKMCYRKNWMTEDRVDRVRCAFKWPEFRHCWPPALETHIPASIQQSHSAGGTGIVFRDSCYPTVASTLLPSS